ncbi:MAG: hypothetical protein ACR2PT_13270 [Endozoicomonas sp.]
MQLHANIVVRSVRACFLLLLLGPCNSHSVVHYIIELHADGFEEVAGSATYQSTQQKQTRSRERNTSRTTLHSINALFFEGQSPPESLTYYPVTEQFFRRSLIGHIWELKAEGQQRRIDLQLRYPEYRYTHTRTYRTRGPVCCFCPYLRSELRTDTHFDVEMTFNDHPAGHGSRQKARANWDINRTDVDSDGCTAYRISLQQNISSRGCSHSSSPDLRHSPVPLKLLSPFAHAVYRGSLMDTFSSAVMYQDENFIFPMDWTFATTAITPVISATIRITGQLLHLYEYRDGSLIKKSEPTALNRYEFITAKGSIDLIIWGIPGDVFPWAREYRAKRRIRGPFGHWQGKYRSKTHCRSSWTVCI